MLPQNSEASRNLAKYSEKSLKDIFLFEVSFKNSRKIILNKFKETWNLEYFLNKIPGVV